MAAEMRGGDLVTDRGGRDGPWVHLFCLDVACIRKRAHSSLFFVGMCVCVCDRSGIERLRMPGGNMKKP